MPNNHFFRSTIEDPARYNIILTSKELKKLNTLINTLIDTNDKAVISKKSGNKAYLKYTLLKGLSSFYLIGDGERNENDQKNVNAFLGKGTIGRAKIAVELEKKELSFELTKNIYVVKIIDTTRVLNKKEFLQTEQNEASFNQIVYGFSELIERAERGRIYLIIPKLPGIELDKISYSNIGIEELINIIVETFKAISKLHKLQILHNDVKPDNILYDKETKRSYIIDFSHSKKFVGKNFSDSDRFKAVVMYIYKAYYSNYKITNADFVDVKQITDKFNEVINSFVEKNSGKFMDSEDVCEDLKSQIKNVFNYVSKLEINSNLLQSLDNKKLSNILNKCIICNEENFFYKILPFCNESVLNDYDYDTRFPLQLSFSYRKFKFFKDLLKLGADVNKKTTSINSALTLLHMIIKSDFNDDEILKLLADKNPSIDIPNSKGVTVRELLINTSSNKQGFLKLKELLVSKEPIFESTNSIKYKS